MHNEEVQSIWSQNVCQIHLNMALMGLTSFKKTVTTITSGEYIQAGGGGGDMHCSNTDKSDEQETMIQKRNRESSFILGDPVVLRDCYGCNPNDWSTFKSDDSFT